MSRTNPPSTRIRRIRPIRFLLCLLPVGLAACDQSVPTSPDAAVVSSRAPGAPEAVVDLEAVIASDSSVTLRWTAVEDGRDQPAIYEMRFTSTPIGWGWGSAGVVVRGSCAAPISAGVVGFPIECEASGLEPTTSYDFQLVAYRETDGGRRYSPLSNVATGVTGSASLPLAFPHEPEGHELIAAHAFAALPTAGPPGDCAAPGASAGCWFRHDPQGNLSLLASSATGDGSALRIRMPAGLGNWDSPGIVQAWTGGSESTGEEYEALYESGFIRVPTPDFELGAGTYLLGFLGVGRAREGDALPTQVRFRVDPVGGNGSVAPAGKMTVVQSGPVSRQLDSNGRSGKTLEFGTWHQYEIALDLNDLGERNGRVRVWIDGALTMDHDDVEWRTDAAPSGFYGRRLDPVWTGGATRARQDVLLIDHLRLSGRGLRTSAPPSPVEAPGAVTDLRVAATGPTSVTLRFTEVSDGAGGAAAHQVRHAATPIGWGWGSATTVVEGTCAEPLAGPAPGSEHECTVTGLTEGASYDFQMSSFREGSEGRVYAASLSNVATGVTRLQKTAPAAVSDLDVTDTGETSVTLRFTEVWDGADGVASYQMRYAPTPIGWEWGSATTVVEGDCATPIAGTAAGAEHTCTVAGLEPGITYDFQMTSFRDDEQGRTYAATLSNVATGAASGPPVDAPVASVEVAPARVTLPSGGTVQLEATLRDAAGNLLDGRAVTWQSSNTLAAAVSATGLVVAGLIPGTTTVSAVSGGVTGAAAIEVTQPVAAEDNEPTGFTPVTERSWDLLEEDGWISIDDPKLSIVADALAPRSPVGVGRATFPAGWTGGSSPIWSSKESGIAEHGYTELYVSFWLKLSDNWQSHPIGNKLGYVWTHGKPVVFPTYVPASDGTMTTEVRLQDIPVLGAVNLTPNVAGNDGVIEPGRWYRWELLLVNNTGDSADGQVHWWVDGVKVGEYHDILISTSGQDKVWEGVHWRPVWGGSGGVVEQDMHMYLDHYYASGR